LSRSLARSPHKSRLLERLEIVRAFFPELDGVCVRVGLVVSRRVEGRGSLDPDEPGIWLRPRAAGFFTMAHELTHLLQARGLLPGGERACDLSALSRSPLLVDSLPTYLRLPRWLPREGPPPPWLRQLLVETARRAEAGRRSGRRDYQRWFERALAAAPARGTLPPLTAGTMEISAPGETGVASPPV
jgi:hypothetical protein